LSVEELENGLMGEHISYSNKLAYPQGLYHSKVEYQYLNLEQRSDFAIMMKNQMDNDWQII